MKLSSFFPSLCMTNRTRILTYALLYLIYTKFYSQNANGIEQQAKPFIALSLQPDQYEYTLYKYNNIHVDFSIHLVIIRN